MNGAKRSMALDFGSRQGVSLLRHLIARADVVLEASRPRALEQLGLTEGSEVTIIIKASDLILATND